MKLPHVLLVLVLLCTFLLPRPSHAQSDTTSPTVLTIWPANDPVTPITWYDEDTPLHPCAVFSEAMDPASEVLN